MNSGLAIDIMADKRIALGVVATISDETVRRTLKKRAQAVAEAAGVSGASDGGLYLADGGSVGLVRRAV
jgi:hypothetical protein